MLADNTVKIHLLYVGRQRQRDTDRLALDYASRIERYCSFQMKPIKNEANAEAYPRALRVVLDPAGEQMTSAELARFVERAGCDMAFFVGGPDGFSDEFRARADRLLSLSKMTLPHELARVVLAEQIYRAFTILRNHPYPR